MNRVKKFIGKVEKLLEPISWTTLILLNLFLLLAIIRSDAWKRLKEKPVKVEELRTCEIVGYRYTAHHIQCIGHHNNPNAPLLICLNDSEYEKRPICKQKQND